MFSEENKVPRALFEDRMAGPEISLKKSSGVTLTNVQMLVKNFRV